MYAMRYGAVPLVNPVGGLKDTVISDKQDENLATGFHIDHWSGEALTKEMEKAIAAYHSSEWSRYIENGMKLDFSWKNSVFEYKKCYEKLIMI